MPESAVEVMDSPLALTVEEVLNSPIAVQPLDSDMLMQIIELKNTEKHPLQRKAQRFLAVYSVNKTYPEHLIQVTKNKKKPKNRTGIVQMLSEINRLSSTKLSLQQMDEIAETLAKDYVYEDKHKLWSMNANGLFKGKTKLYLSPRHMMTDWYLDFCFYILWDQDQKPYFFVYDRHPKYSFKSKVIPLDQLGHLNEFITMDAYNRSWDEVLDRQYHFYETEEGNGKKVNFNQFIRE
ncbi:MAG: hypothetical protein R2877_08455 [Bdellovibrionota bacterium]